MSYDWQESAERGSKPQRQDRNRTLLSISMIVKNEENFLEGCLRSVADIADEIVIVDTGSTDNTLSIAREFNCRIVPFEWVNDFSAARNESLKHCTGEWILYLDADERLAPGSIEELSRILSDPDGMAYNCLLRSEERLPAGRVFNVAPYPRLFRRMSSFRFKGRVHEQIEDSIRETGNDIRPSGIIIEHLGYAQDADTILAKCERNVELLKKELEEMPSDAYVRFQLGNTLAILGRTEESATELKLALHGQGLANGLCVSILNCLGHVASREERTAEGIRYAEESLAKNPEQVTARWLLAMFRMRENDFPSALGLLEGIEVIQRDSHRSRSFGQAFDASIPQEVLFTQMGVCHERLGAFAYALGAYYRALQLSSSHSVALERYQACLLMFEDVSAIKDQLLWLKELQVGSVVIANAYIRSCLQTGDSAAALDELQRCRNAGIMNDDTQALRIEFYLQQADQMRALDAYQAACKSGANSYRFHKVAVKLLVMRRDFTRMLPHLEQMGKEIEQINH